MTIYIDSDYKCYAAPGEGLREVETETGFFDGKCKAFIEGYRFIPPGEAWAREDGEVFTGEMIAPFVDYRILEAAQNQYEAMLPELEDKTAALAAIYAGEVAE